MLDDFGRVWVWGDNTYGQLGDGTHEPRSAPVMVNGLPDPVSTPITAVSASGTPGDTDGDGSPDHQDGDSDDDGISDEVERGYDSETPPADTDGDGTPDFQDAD